MLKQIIISALILTTAASVYAEEVKPLKVKAETNVANMDMVIKDNFVKAKYASAENRFAQSNVKASYDDFNDLIQRASSRYTTNLYYLLPEALLNKLLIQ